MKYLLMLILTFSAISVQADEKLAGVRAEMADRASRTGITQDEQQPDLEPLKNNGFVMLQGLGLCIAVLLIGAHVYRRFHPAAAGRSAHAREIVLVERLSLSRGASISLIEVAGKRILVANGTEHISMTSLPLEAPDFGAVLDEGESLLTAHDGGGRTCDS